MGPARRRELRWMVAVALVAIAAALVVPLVADYAPGVTEWDALTIVGLRIQRIALVACVLALAVDLVRERSAVPATLALAVVAPQWTWAGG